MKLSPLFKTLAKHSALLLLLCVMLIGSSAKLQAQDFNVQFTLPMLASERLSVCGDAQLHKIRIENISGNSLTDVQLSLNLPTGLFYVGGTLVNGTEVTVTPPVFDVGDFKPGTVVEIEYFLDVNCDGIALGNSDSDISYTFDLNYGGGAGSQLDEESDDFEVVKPTLSFPNVIGNASGSNVFDADLGSIDTLKVTVVNGNNGSLREFTYCVINDHPNITISSVSVAGVNIPLAYTSPTGDRAYFIIDQDDINNAVSLNPPADDPDLFQFNESLTICEAWETIGCPDPENPDIVRSAFYGCDGTDNCEETPPSYTGVRFGFLKPTLYANDYYHAFNYDVALRDRPSYSDCYQNPAEPLYFEYAFVNTGQATLKLKDFVIELHALGYEYIPWDIDPNSVELYFKDGPNTTPVPGITVDSVINNTVSSYITNCHDGDATSIRKIAHVDECILIPVGDTLIYKVDFFYDNADCGKCSDVYSQFSFPYLQAEEIVYSDQCNATEFSDVSGNAGPRLRNYQRVLAEGPSNAFAGVPLTTCFTYTGGENYLFNYSCPSNGQPQNGQSYDSDRYHINSPNAWNEIWYIIPEGMDFAGTDGDVNSTDACLTDAQGDIYPIFELDYTDNGVGPDTVKVRYQGAGNVCFDWNSNPKYKINTMVDCDEGPPFCDKTVSIRQEKYYVTECGLDGTQCFEEIDVPRPWNVTIQNCYCAPCEGIVFTYIDLARQTYGIGDANNDGIDDGDPLDLNAINTLRFTTGDTIKATYGGWINLIDDFGYPLDYFEYAYGAVNIPITGTWGNSGVSPLTAELTVWDASNGNAQYTCDLVQMFPDGQKVVANISTQSLIGLGCNGMPSDFVYEQGDSLSLCIYFRVKDWDDATQAINFGSEFYASDFAYGEGLKYQCNTLNQTMNYIGYVGYNDWVYRDVAGCNDGKDNNSNNAPNNNVTASDVHRTLIRLGAAGFDDFPFEIREIAVPTSQTFVNNSDLMWGKDFSLSVLDANGHLSPTGGYLAWQNFRVDMASSPCFTITATTVDVDYDCLFNQIGYDRFDEGLYLYATPDLSPGCMSEYEAPFTYKDVDAYTNWDVTESVFCTPVMNMVDTVAAQNDGILEPWNNNQVNDWIYSDTGLNAHDYVYLSSLPSIELMPITFTNLLLEEEACFEVTVENRGDASADNAFFTFESPSGGVVFQSVMDAATGTSLMSNVGVVELGQMAPGDFRTLEICVTSNNCDRDSIVVNSGWDCNGYPGSPQEIQCSVPETLYLEIPEAELGMVVLSPDPATPVFVDLCSELEYVLQISSADVGAIHDIDLRYRIPVGHTMVPGSFEIAYPVNLASSTQNWYTSPTQPTQLGGGTGNVFRIIIDPNDPIISQNGLVGTTDLSMNYFWVRYKTYIGCGARSGSRGAYRSLAKDPCDARTNSVTSPGPVVKINGVSDPYISSLTVPNPAVLNACEGNTIPIDIEFDLETGSQPIGPSDSLMVELPAGIMFQPGSYVAGTNAEPASATNPVLQANGLGQLVFIDLKDGVTAGNTIAFTFNIFAEDVAQDCRDYDILVSTFNTQMVECATTGELCDVRAVSDEVSAKVTVVKPDLSIKNVMLQSCALPPDMETLDYCLDIMNMGAPVAAGTTTNIELYDDSNDNGDIDIGVDVYIGMLSTTNAIPSGGTTMICGTTTIPSGMSCNVIAVINPETTCACSYDESFRVGAELKIPFAETEWEVCSNELIPSVGPDPLDNVTYEWVGINGANTTAFGSTTTTPTTYQFANTTGSTVVFEYYLRSVSNDDCAVLDTIQITIFPEEHGEVALQACPFDEFNMSGPAGNTNYSWSPQLGLTDPFSAMTDVDATLYAPGTYNFTLTYTDVNGCPGDYNVEVTIVPCALTYVGNYLWCDENNNGLQDDGTPLQGFTVNLYSSTNTTAPIASAVTDANGYYLFGPIPQAEYIIGVDVPTNYQLATQDAGGDDTIDSDIGSGFLTAPFFLSNGDSLTTIDMGVLCPKLDLELEKEVYADMSETPIGAVSVGDVVWWKVEVCNRTMAPDTVNFDALGVVVADTLPFGITYQSSSATMGSYDPNTGLWTIGQLENGTCDVLWIETIVTLDVLPVTNTAQVSAGDDPDIDSDPNNDDGDQSEDDEDNATIGPGADLRLTKTVSALTPQENDNVTFTITLTNDGPSVATNVVVSDTIPACLTYVSNNGGSAGSVDDTNAPTIDWTIPSIAVNQTMTLTITGTANTIGDCCNYAQVTDADQPDPDSETNNDDGDQSEDDEDKAQFEILPDCEMAIASIVVGDCNPLTNEYTITVNVTYANLAPGTTSIGINGQGFALDYTGSQAFVITGLVADGMSHTVSAFMAGDVDCADTDTYTAPNVCTPFDCTATSTDVACNGGSDGTATATANGGTAPFSYNWSPGGQTTASITGVTSGTYNVTITDDNGVTSMCTTIIDEPASLACTTSLVSDISCNGGSDGSATVTPTGGTFPYTYAWSSAETTQTATALVLGANTVTVTDANGCTGSCSVTVGQPDAITCSTAVVDPTCPNSTDGTVTVTASGGTSPLEFSLNGGAWQPGNVFNNVAPGSYTVTTRDANLCTGTCTATLTAPGSFTCSVVENAPASCGMQNGAATVTPAGGVAPYTYAWDNLETGMIASALSAGVHSVTVTDDNNCTTTCSVTIMTVTGLMCEITASSDVTCAGAADGSATITVTGGSTPYSYAWTGGYTTATVTSFSGGMYSVTVTDADDCTTVCMVDIDEPVALVCAVVKDGDISCNGADDGSATVSASGGSPNYTYAWSNGETTAAAVSLTPGTNTVTITDDNDCTVVCDVDILEPAALSCTLASTPSACMGQDNGTVTTTTEGGTAPLSYAINGGASQTGPVFSNLAPGSYTVVVTDDNGCTTDCTVEVAITGCEFDLALVKQLTPGQPNPVDPGDQISFTITVFNQGQIPADNIDVVDYVPAGLTFNPADPTNVLYGWFVGTAGVETTASVANGLLPAGGLAPGADVQLILILDVAHNAPQGTTITNYAEISDATDDDGNPQDDIDSDPDDDDSNDGPSEDNDTDGTNGDEDDHDPEEIEINYFDLALTKVLATGQSTTVAPGDNVDFTITVYNQGTIAADNIEITDYVPTCMQNVDTDWSGPSSGPVTITLSVANGDLPAGGLAPGGFTQVDITLQVLGSATQTCDLTNWAEISDDSDTDGDAITDVDSTPDGDDSNDNYGGDDETGNTNGDEDDHDPASVDLLMADLALAKDLGTGENSSVAVGQDVTFTITIENQGSIAADNIDIVDYLDPCMTLNDSDWGGTNPATYTMSVANGDLPAGGLLPMQQATVDVTVTISCAPASGQLVNVAEIESFTDEDGNPLEDDDSTPDDDPDNDPPGEDDIDDEPLNILEFDLALSKDLAAGQSSQVSPGDLITYTISVVNQGQIAADNIEITDYVGACFTLADANWSLSAAGAVYTLSVANGDLPAGGLVPGATTTVDITLQLDNPVAASCDLSNVAEISDATDDDGNPQEDSDSDPDDDDSNDPPGEDDIDDVPVELLEFDLALSKELAPGQSSTVAPGDLITYEITVVNQGDIAGDNIEITDYVGTCFTLADANWTTSAAGAVYTMSVANGDLPAGGLAPGGTASVQITLQLDNPVAANCDLSNVAEISGATDDDGDPVDDSDSDPDDDDSNDPPGEDDIDDVPVSLLGFDLALSKDLAPGQSSNVAPGDLITYEISVVNQGDIAGDNIEITDYVGACFTLADANWTTSAAGAVYTMSVANGDLPAGGLIPGATASVQITLQLDNPVAAGCDLSNVAEISGATDEDGDPVDDTDSDPDDDDSNDPPGEDDIDDVPVNLLEFDLALSKDLAAGQPSAVAPGDLITYDITVLNQGAINADNIEIADYIPTCMTLADTDWTLTGGTAYYTLSVANGDLPAGGLAPMGMASVEITLQLNNPVAAGCSTTNVAEISDATDDDGMPQDDVDSDPDDDDSNDPPGEDDIDDEPIDILEFDLALTKALAVGQSPQVMVGDDVTFTFTVTNQGQIAADNIEISDYIPSDFVLNDTDWSGTNPAVYTISVANGDLAAGGLLPGQMVMVDITLTVQMTAIEGNTYINEGEISDATDEDGMPQDDVDSDPDNDPNNDPPGEDDIDDEPVVIMGNCDLAQIKTFNNFNSNGDGTGGLATFDVTVTNQGNCDAYNVGLVDYILPGWTLSDAAWYLSPFDGNAYYTIAGPILPGATETVTITFAVTSFDPLNPQTNWTEITGSEDFNGDEQDDADSDPDSNPNNDGPPTNDDTDGTNGDEDDHDFEDIQIIDLAIDKSLNPAMMPPYAYGDDITFDICVTNEGNATVNAATVTDNIPAGFTFNAALNPTWTNTAPAVDHTFAGPIAPTDQVCESIILTFVSGGMSIDDYTNVAEITEVIDEDGNPNDDDWDSTPDNDDGDQSEDDEDAEVFQVFDLSLDKVATSTGPYSYGDDATFDFVICNEGSVTATNIVIADDIPCGYEFISSPGWSLSNGELVTTIAGPVGPGSCETISLEVIVRPCDQAGAWNNTAEIQSAVDENGDPVDDIDSDPNNEDPNEDDQDEEEIEVFDLASIKQATSGSGPYLFGDFVEYTITIFNQGNVDAANILVNEYLPAGLQYNAAYVHPTGATPNANAAWTVDPVTGFVQQTIMTGGSTLAAGTSTTVVIYLEVVPANDIEDWYNLSEIGGATDGDGDPTEDADSDPDGDPANDGDPEDDEYNGEDNDGDGNPDEDDHDIEEIIVAGDVGDTVWKDTNGDGIQDPGEAGVAGVVVTLYDCDGTEIAQTTTDANGNYLFEQVIPGSYYINFDISGLPSGCDFTIPGQGTDANNSDADANGDTPCFDTDGTDYLDVDAGLLPLSGLGNYVWFDMDGDGIQDPGEPGIGGVQVDLYDQNGNYIATTYTDGNGGYFFSDLYPGHYYVEFTPPSGYDTTIANSGGSDLNDSDLDGTNGPNTTASTWLDAGEIDSSWDAGFHTCVEIGDLLWFDVNNNGISDTNENGINGVKVELYKIENGSASLFDFTFTGHKPGTPSDDGYWKFCAPPGEYYVKFDITSSSLAAVTPWQGTSDVDSNVDGSNGANTTATFSAISGTHRCDIDGGYRSTSNVTSGTTPTFTSVPTNVAGFTGTYQRSHIGLSFTATTDDKQSHFVIERSLDGAAYAEFAKVLAKQTGEEETYMLKDYDVYDDGLYTYRLSLVDMVDNTKEQDLVEVRVDNGLELGSKLYPNPAVDFVTLEIEASKSASVKAILVNANGSVIDSELIKTTIESGVNVYNLDISSLPPGFYTIRVQADEKVIDKKLIVIGQ